VLLGYVVRAGDELGRVVAQETARMRRAGETGGPGPGDADAGTGTDSDSGAGWGGATSEGQGAGRGRVVVGMHVRRGHKAIEVRVRGDGEERARLRCG
jgi:hypothetical protein